MTHKCSYCYCFWFASKLPLLSLLDFVTAKDYGMCRASTLEEISPKVIKEFPIIYERGNFGCNDQNAEIKKY